MKKSITNTLKSILLLLLMTAPSCLDLNEAPESMLTPGNFYSTLSQCESALVGSMNSLLTTWNGYNSTPSWPDGQKSGGSLGFGPSTFTSHWQWHYRSINNINPVIKSIKAGRLSTENQTSVDDLLGQAYFLRAFNYFWLVQLYGRIPFIDEDTPDLVTNPLTPESKLDIDKVYDKIETDLNNAFNLMADYNNSRKSRPCKWSAKALLAKVYLTRATAPLKQTDNYAKARDAADAVIGSGKYDMVDLIDIFKTSNPNNKEFIFAFQFTDDFPALPGINWGPESDWDTWGEGGVKNLWAEAYPEQPRKHYYIRLNWPKNLSDPSDKWVWTNYVTSGDQHPWDGKKTWPNLSISQQLDDGGNSGVLLPILRYSEMLLIYAEAANMANNGPTQLAVDRLNLIIDRANAAFTSQIPQTSTAGTEERATISMTKDAFNAKVLAERDWELCFEYTAYFDVLRTQTLEQVNEPEVSRNFKETDYLFPIPPYDAEFIGNNPGYK